MKIISNAWFIIYLFWQAKELAEYSLADVLCRLLYLNSPELHFLILGFIFSTISGTIFPAYSIFFGEILQVSVLDNTYVT